MERCRDECDTRLNTVANMISVGRIGCKVAKVEVEKIFCDAEAENLMDWQKMLWLLAEVFQSAKKMRSDVSTKAKHVVGSPRHTMVTRSELDTSWIFDRFLDTQRLAVMPNARWRFF